MGWRVRRAAPADASALSLVASASFLNTFAGKVSGPDMIAHCARKSSPAAFEAWAADPETVLTIAEHPNGAAPVGYSVLTAPDLPVALDADDIELRRIYTMPLANGTGLGARLMERAVEDARSLDKQRLWLGAAADNRRACDFYLRQGFTVAGERRFLVGEAWFDDLIFVRLL